jgi:hypothetical protein
MTCGRPLACHRHRAIRHPDKAVLDDRVTAAMLGGIEGGIGGLDQVARPLRFVRPGAGDPDADGDGLMEAGDVRHCEVLDRGADRLAYLQGAVRVGVGQEETKFLAAIAARKSQGVGGNSGQRLAEPAQAGVAFVLFLCIFDYL